MSQSGGGGSWGQQTLNWGKSLVRSNRDHVGSPHPPDRPTPHTTPPLSALSSPSRRPSFTIPGRGATGAPAVAVTGTGLGTNTATGTGTGLERTLSRGGSPIPSARPPHHPVVSESAAGRQTPLEQAADAFRQREQQRGGGSGERDDSAAPADSNPTAYNNNDRNTHITRVHPSNADVWRNLQVDDDEQFPDAANPVSSSNKQQQPTRHNVIPPANLQPLDDDQLSNTHSISVANTDSSGQGQQQQISGGGGGQRHPRVPPLPLSPHSRSPDPNAAARISAGEAFLLNQQQQQQHNQQQQNVASETTAVDDAVDDGVSNRSSSSPPQVDKTPSQKDAYPSLAVPPPRRSGDNNAAISSSNNSSSKITAASDTTRIGPQDLEFIAEEERFATAPTPLSILAETGDAATPLPLPLQQSRRSHSGSNNKNNTNNSKSNKSNNFFSTAIQEPAAKRVQNSSSQQQQHDIGGYDDNDNDNDEHELQQESGRGSAPPGPLVGRGSLDHRFQHHHHHHHHHDAAAAAAGAVTSPVHHNHPHNFIHLFNQYYHHHQHQFNPPPHGGHHHHHHIRHMHHHNHHNHAFPSYEHQHQHGHHHNHHHFPPLGGMFPPYPFLHHHHHHHHQQHHLINQEDGEDSDLPLPPDESDATAASGVEGGARRVSDFAAGAAAVGGGGGGMPAEAINDDSNGSSAMAQQGSQASYVSEAADTNNMPYHTYYSDTFTYNKPTVMQDGGNNHNNNNNVYPSVRGGSGSFMTDDGLHGGRGGSLMSSVGAGGGGTGRGWSRSWPNAQYSDSPGGYNNNATNNNKKTSRFSRAGSYSSELYIGGGGDESEGGVGAAGASSRQQQQPTAGRSALTGKQQQQQMGMGGGTGMMTTMGERTASAVERELVALQHQLQELELMQHNSYSNNNPAAHQQQQHDPEAAAAAAGDARNPLQQQQQQRSTSQTELMERAEALVDREIQLRALLRSLNPNSSILAKLSGRQVSMERPTDGAPPAEAEGRGGHRPAHHDQADDPEDDMRDLKKNLRAPSMSTEPQLEFIPVNPSRSTSSTSGRSAGGDRKEERTGTSTRGALPYTEYADGQKPPSRVNSIVHNNSLIDQSSFDGGSASSMNYRNDDGRSRPAGHSPVFLSPFYNAVSPLTNPGNNTGLGRRGTSRSTAGNMSATAAAGARDVTDDDGGGGDKARRAAAGSMDEIKMMSPLEHVQQMTEARQSAAADHHENVNGDTSGGTRAAGGGTKKTVQISTIVDDPSATRSDDDDGKTEKEKEKEEALAGKAVVAMTHVAATAERAIYDVTREISEGVVMLHQLLQTCTQLRRDAVAAAAAASSSSPDASTLTAAAANSSANIASTALVVSSANGDNNNNDEDIDLLSSLSAAVQRFSGRGGRAGAVVSSLFSSTTRYDDSSIGTLNKEHRDGHDLVRTRVPFGDDSVGTAHDVSEVLSAVAGTFLLGVEPLLQRHQEYRDITDARVDGFVESIQLERAELRRQQLVIDDTNETLSTLDTQLTGEIHGSLEQLKRDIAVKDARLRELERELQQVSVTEANMQQFVSKSQAEAEVLREELRSLRAVNEQKGNRVTEEREKVSDIQMHLTRITERRTNVVQEVETLDIENAALQQRLQQLKGQLEDRRRAVADKRHLVDDTAKPMSASSTEENPLFRHLHGSASRSSSSSLHEEKESVSENVAHETQQRTIQNEIDRLRLQLKGIEQERQQTLKNDSQEGAEMDKTTTASAAVDGVESRLLLKANRIETVEIPSLEKDTRALEEEMAEIRREIDAYRGDTSEIDHGCQELETELTLVKRVLQRRVRSAVEEAEATKQQEVEEYQQNYATSAERQPVANGTQSGGALLVGSEAEQEDETNKDIRRASSRSEVPSTPIMSVTPGMLLLQHEQQQEQEQQASDQEAYRNHYPGDGGIADSNYVKIPLEGQLPIASSILRGMKPDVNSLKLPNSQPQPLHPVSSTNGTLAASKFVARTKADAFIEGDQRARGLQEEEEESAYHQHQTSLLAQLTTHQNDGGGKENRHHEESSSFPKPLKVSLPQEEENIVYDPCGLPAPHPKQAGGAAGNQAIKSNKHPRDAVAADDGRLVAAQSPSRYNNNNNNAKQQGLYDFGNQVTPPRPSAMQKYYAPPAASSSSSSSAPAATAAASQGDKSSAQKSLLDQYGYALDDSYPPKITAASAAAAKIRRQRQLQQQLLERQQQQQQQEKENTAALNSLNNNKRVAPSNSSRTPPVTTLIAPKVSSASSINNSSGVNPATDKSAPRTRDSSPTMLSPGNDDDDVNNDDMANSRPPSLSLTRNTANPYISKFSQQQQKGKGGGAKRSSSSGGAQIPPVAPTPRSHSTTSSHQHHSNMNPGGGGGGGSANVSSLTVAAMSAVLPSPPQHRGGDPDESANTAVSDSNESDAQTVTTQSNNIPLQLGSQGGGTTTSMGGVMVANPQQQHARRRPGPAVAQSDRNQNTYQNAALMAAQKRMQAVLNRRVR